MPTSEASTGLPARPADVAEWEELLVRVEIMPRALRAALEDAPGEDARVVEILDGLLERELGAGRWLEAAATGAPPPVAAPATPERDPRGLADRFAAVRTRNFAMLQRRGVEVWEWAGATAEGERATVYQLLTALVRADAAALAALRGVRAC